jgi:hypothetical protein
VGFPVIRVAGRDRWKTSKGGMILPQAT